MSKIKVMDSKLANMIAAGEVIERPASVIKELVENSIDAESDLIEVSIKDAGRTFIQVVDDGCGMDREDAKLSFTRHASSKLLSEFDLFKIKTMGFRGEALPSIASVSKVTMMTSTGVDKGTRIVLQDENMQVEDYMALKGTSITVEELFYNTPARLKYLKLDVTENAKSMETMEHLALARPDISFTFNIDNREVFSTSGRNDLLEVIARLYGNEVAKKMTKISFSTYEFQIDGYIGAPELAKSNRYYMITILNGRAVYMPKIQKSIISAYKEYLFNDRYPFVILKINVEPSLVDVNVHPAKREVRLSNENHLMMAIENEIRKLLKKDKPLHEISFKPTKIVEIQPSLLEEKEEKGIQEIVRPQVQNEIKVQPEVNKPSIDLENLDEKVNTISEPILHEENVKKHFKIPLLNPIGQINKTYIVCDSDDGFYLIDQHAANERINYERFQNFFNNRLDVVEPLVPLIINVKPSDALKLTDSKIKLFKEIGIEIESFGFNAFKVISYPTFFNECSEENYIEELFNQVINDDKFNLYSLRKHVIATMACKASIKAHDLLNEVEMKDTINRLFACENPTCCPHGRPTIIHLSKYDIDKMFKRTGI